jgi:PKD repeat protein
MVGGYACAAETKGAIYINSNPEGADIFLTDPSTTVDGLSVDTLIGVTPNQFFVEPGTYNIYLQKYGYVSKWYDPFVVGPGEMLNFGIWELEPQAAMYGALHIETNPADASIILDRLVEKYPEIESRVYGNTPLSLESLPPGTYTYEIKKAGYHEEVGSVEVTLGAVSEVAVALIPVAVTEPVRFNSLPAGAEVFILPKNFDGLDLEALDVAEIRAKADYVGYIGYTPTTFEMPEGDWFYLMKKDSHEEIKGEISVQVGIPVPDVNRELTPIQQSVEVYFESELDPVTISYNGEIVGTTRQWVKLPAETYAEVTFAKEFYEDSTIPIDTSLLMGRPSRWGTSIDLAHSMYTIRTEAGEYIRIIATPAGDLPNANSVVAGGCAPMYEIFTESPDYQIMAITLDGEKLMDIEPGTDSIVLNQNGTCDGASDIKVIRNNMVLKVESEKKKYTIEVVVGPGGTANPPGPLIEVLSGDESPGFFFTPDSGYVLLEPEMDGREQWIKPGNGPYSFGIVRQNHIIKAGFRPTHVTVTLEGDLTNGSMDPMEPFSYEIPYNGCTKLHTLIPNEGYIGQFIFNPPADTVEAEAVNPRTVQFQQCQVTQDLTIGISIIPLLFNIQSSASGNGIISPAGEQEKEYMSSVTFDITADPGNSLIKVLDNGVDVGIPSQETPTQYVLSDISTDHVIEAFFTGSSDYLTITPHSSPGGTIVPSEPQVNVPRGSDVTFTITPDSCYTIGSIVITDIASAAETRDGPFSSQEVVTLENVQSSHEIYVQFDQKYYNIDVTQAEGGKILPETNPVPVLCGESMLFTITPDAGNSVNFLIVDGVETKPDQLGTYTFSNVVQDHTFSVLFTMPPNPEFSSDLIRAPPKYPVKFNDLTTNSPTDVLWDFGDGEVSREREPTHYYASTGIYTVKLTAFNAASPQAGITIEKNNYIEITTDPIAKFIVEPEIGMTPPGFTVNMTNYSLNAETKDRVTFVWDFGDGKGSSLGRSPSYTYTSPGVYKVGLKVEKPYIAADYYYQTITILQEPIADFMAHPLSGPAPLTVQFEDKSQGFPTSWFWSFDDGSGSYDISPTHIYAEPGVYSVTLDVRSDEGVDSKTVERLITVT